MPLPAVCPLTRDVTTVKRVRVGLAILAVLLAVSMQSGPFHTVHAVANEVYISPSYVPPARPGYSFNISVQVANIEPYNGWDIAVKSDPTVIVPSKVSIMNNAMAINYSLQIVESINCVNNMGSGCNSEDSSGVAHSSVFAIGNRTQGISSGLLFTVTYNVTGNGNYSGITLLRPVQIGSGVGFVPVVAIDGSYGKGPDFKIYSAQEYVNVTVGGSANVTIFLDSLNNFSGIVSLAANLTGSSSSSGVGLSLQSTVSLLRGGSANVVLNIITKSSTPATGYRVNVTGTNGSLQPHSILIQLSVRPPPNFILGATPSLLQLHAGSTGTSKIIIESLRGYSANITLSIQGPGNVIATLNPVNVVKAQMP